MSTTWQVQAAEGTETRTDGLRGISLSIKALADRVHARVREHLAERRMRRQLAQLDDRLLRDIGVDPEMRDGIGKVRGFAEALQTMRDHR